MNQSLLKTTIILAALTLLWGCSSSDDDNKNELSSTTEWITASEKPSWAIDWTHNDPIPDWQEPDVSNFENWMFIIVKMQKELVPYVSEDDIMAVFINDELRGLTNVAINLDENGTQDYLDQYFILKVYGHGESEQPEKFTNKYYCAKLHQLFTIEGMDKFVPEEVLGGKEDFIPQYLLGSSKYPVVMNLDVQFLLDATQPFEASADDLVAVFVGDECRGCTTVGNSLLAGTLPLTVYGRQSNEAGTLRYFSTKKNAVSTFKTPVIINAGNQNLSININ